MRQLVHHVADSHINAYVRMRLALTEDWPTIKPYEEAEWAKLEDARTLPVEVSLALLQVAASSLGSAVAEVVNRGRLGAGVCASGERAGEAGDRRCDV